MTGYDSPISFPGFPSVPAPAVSNIQRPSWYKFMPAKDWNKWWDSLPAGWRLVLAFAGTAAYYIVPCAIAIGTMIFILVKTDP